MTAFSLYKASLISPGKVRVAFNRDVKQDSSSETDDALYPGNYRLSSAGRHRAVRTVTSVDSYTVDLDVDDVDTSLAYTLTAKQIASGVGAIIGGDPVAVDHIPHIKSVEALSSTELLVTLSTDVRLSFELLLTTSYVITPETAVKRVQIVAGDRVKLTTAEMTAEEPYVLSFGSDVIGTLIGGFNESNAAILLL